VTADRVEHCLPGWLERTRMDGGVGEYRRVGVGFSPAGFGKELDYWYTRMGVTAVQKEAPGRGTEGEHEQYKLRRDRQDASATLGERLSSWDPWWKGERENANPGPPWRPLPLSCDL